MRALIWSLVERVFPRLAGALMMLLIARFMSPLVVGLYAWPMFILTFYYSALDGAIRQVVVPSWGSRNAVAFLVKYRFWASTLGALAMILTLGVLLIVFPSHLRGQIFSLAPLILVPFANSFAIMPLGYLQLREKWRPLAVQQVWSAGLSLLASVPAVLITHSLLGAAIQVLLGEALFAVLAQRAALRLGMRSHRDGLELGAHYGREFVHASFFFITGWLQGQADRILVGSISGTSALGSYNFALAIARNPGDAVSASTANVLRVEVSRDREESPQELAHRADKVLVRATLLGVALVLGLFAGIEIVLRPFLGARWATPLDASVIMAASILPTIVAWSLAPILMAVGRLSWGTPIKVIGILMAVPIALAATHSITLAAWFVVLREVVMLVLLMVACRGSAPWRAFTVSLIATIGCLVLALVLNAR
jgi:O-antigen/teichoic acid export membrane protein